MDSIKKKNPNISVSRVQKREKKRNRHTKNFIRINNDLNHLKLGKSYKLIGARDSEKKIQ